MSSTARKEFTNVDDDNLNDGQNKALTTENISIINFKINPVTILTQSNHTDRQLAMPPPFKKSFSACNTSFSKGSILPP